ncbi:hypothetical protein SteCoe_13536 [Stentor coeruleus]|uniref:Uncharacterized protein n=1 Tax=Stentor coeruleus TaxID=5963 RepID=A0A1R2C8C9_9CILI|nr:hypothetical protein SteCoe_13536 [Stentor coeruleus]
MSKDFQDALVNFSIFSNIYSILNPSSGIWPVSMNLPYPTASPMQLGQKLPNIFPDEPRSKCKTVTACPHSARKHYAKNMCNNCYHRLGRDKTAWNCEHHDRKHYAKGKCQFCYLKHYNKSRQEIQSSIDNI